MSSFVIKQYNFKIVLGRINGELCAKLFEMYATQQEGFENTQYGVKSVGSISSVLAFKSSPHH